MPPQLLAAWRELTNFAGLVRAALFDPDRLWPILAEASTASRRWYLAIVLLGIPLIMPTTLIISVEWRNLSTPATGQVTPMAINSPMGASLGRHGFPPQLAGMTAGPRTAAAVFGGAVASYAGGVASVLFAAITIWLFARISGARSRQGIAGCVQLVAWGGLPFWLSCIGLSHPSLLPLLAIGLLHACYVTHSGVCQQLETSSSDAAVLLAIVALTLLIAAPLASYLASALLASLLRLAG